MSDISNLLIKDSYDYVIQVDPITHYVYRIGGAIPINPIYLSGLTVYSSFKFSNGTEQNNYVLTSDSQGNATWKPISGATSGSSGTSGTSGTGFNTVQNPALTRLLTSDGTPNGAIAQSGLTFSGNTLYLHNGNIQDVSYIDFNTGTTVPSSKTGRVFFDVNEYSLSYFPDVNQNVIVRVGQQLYTRVNNVTGTLIPKGSAVKISSASNGLPNVSLAIASHPNNERVVGLAADDIPNGGVGLVLNNGLLSGITLNTFSVGDILYLSDTTPGGYVSSTASLQFNSRTNEIGYVVATGSSTGQIYVNINNEDMNLTLTNIERNILEGNVISTGAYEYTGMTLSLIHI